MILRILMTLMMTLMLNFKVSASEGTILIIGDSLSAAYGMEKEQGWPHLLQDRLEKEAYAYRVVNASVSGDTTRTGLGRLGDALRIHEPDIVIIALGGNDGLRALAFSEIENSLSKMIELSRQADASVLLAAVRLPPNNGPAYNRLFAEIYTRLSGKYDVPLVPRMLDQVADFPELMQEDGMHPKAAGQPRVLENIWKQLVTLLRLIQTSAPSSLNIRM